MAKGDVIPTIKKITVCSQRHVKNVLGEVTVEMVVLQIYYRPDTPTRFLGVQRSGKLVTFQRNKLQRPSRVRPQRSRKKVVLQVQVLQKRRLSVCRWQMP